MPASADAPPDMPEAMPCVSRFCGLRAPRLITETPALPRRVIRDGGRKTARTASETSLASIGEAATAEPPGNAGGNAPGGTGNRTRRNKLNRGGGGGIRTRDTVSRIHTFQACAFSRSATPPHRALESARRLSPNTGPQGRSFGRPVVTAGTLAPYHHAVAQGKAAQ